MLITDSEVDNQLLSQAGSNDGLSKVLAADAAPRLSRFARRAMAQKPEVVYEQKQDSGLRFNFEYSVSELDAQVVRLGTPWLAQRALADYMDAGHYARRIRRLSRRYAARRSSLLAALNRYLGDEITIGDSSAGMHVLICLNRISPDRLPALIEKAARRDVQLHSVALYYMNPPRRTGLLMGYTLLSEDEITEGVRRLGALVERF